MVGPTHVRSPFKTRQTSQLTLEFTGRKTGDPTMYEVFWREVGERVAKIWRSMTMCLMMVSLSTSFPSFEEGIQFLNDGEQQQVQIMEAEPHLLLCVKKWCQTDRYESNDAGDQLEGRHILVGAQQAMEIVAKANRVTVIDHEMRSKKEKYADDPMTVPRDIME
ncbi:hypothetical protein ZWY2020_028539 [Hordeum vulgare]|nr:hypothetical protein ZWY2020_028539 [Hordeum vulgare]